MASRYISVYVYDKQVIHYGSNDKENIIKYLQKIIVGDEKLYTHLLELGTEYTSWQRHAKEYPIKIRVMKKNKCNTKSGIEIRGVIKDKSYFRLKKLENVRHQTDKLITQKRPEPLEVLTAILKLLNLE